MKFTKEIKFTNRDKVYKQRQSPQKRQSTKEIKFTKEIKSINRDKVHKHTGTTNSTTLHYTPQTLHSTLHSKPTIKSLHLFIPILYTKMEETSSPFPVPISVTSPY